MIRPPPGTSDTTSDDTARASVGSPRAASANSAACSRRSEQIADAPQHAVAGEGARRGQGDDQHHRHRREHDQPRQHQLGVDGAGQPAVARPGPPDERQQDQSAAQLGERRVLGEEPGDLRQREHEDEVEEQLERRDDRLVRVGADESAAPPFLLDRRAHRRELDPMRRTRSSRPRRKSAAEFVSGRARGAASAPRRCPDPAARPRRGAPRSARRRAPGARAPARARGSRPATPTAARRCARGSPPTRPARRAASAWLPSSAACVESPASASATLNWSPTWRASARQSRNPSRAASPLPRARSSHALSISGSTSRRSSPSRRRSSSASPRRCSDRSRRPWTMS